MLGLIGNATFSRRKRHSDIVLVLEHRREPHHVPYFLFRRDPVGILAYLPNTIVYLRNLMFIRKRKLAFTAAAPSQEPRETN